MGIVENYFLKNLPILYDISMKKWKHVQYIEVSSYASYAYASYAFIQTQHWAKERNKLNSDNL